MDRFKVSNIKKDRIHLLISLRETEKKYESDMKNSENLINAITENGFVVTYRKDIDTRSSCGDKIEDMDEEFYYPVDYKELFDNLNTYCAKYGSCNEAKKKDCSKKLNRYPILRANHMCSLVVTFERKAKS